MHQLVRSAAREVIVETTGPLRARTQGSSIRQWRWAPHMSKPNGF